MVSAIDALERLLETPDRARPLRVVIFGLGYVGLTAAGCLLALGHRVTGVDPDAAKVVAIESGLSPVAEPGLAGLIDAGRTRRHLVFATDAGDALDAADVALVCVGTPGSEEGPHDLSAVSEVVADLCRRLAGRRHAPALVFRSTLPPGTMDRLVLPPLRAAGVCCEVVYNPEYMRETTSVADFMAPARIVAGTADGGPSAIIARLYAGIDAPIYSCDYRTAELSKLVDNAAHALKVAFANEVARIGNGLDADVARLIEIFLADTKLNISPRYLQPGGAFGGSCLQKDLTALTHLAGRLGIAAPVFGAALTSNAAHKRHLLRRLTAGLAPDAGILLVGVASSPAAPTSATAPMSRSPPTSPTPATGWRSTIRRSTRHR
jgi:GDP-mannose 6-dehydrogenase